MDKSEELYSIGPYNAIQKKLQYDFVQRRIKTLIKEKKLDLAQQFIQILYKSLVDGNVPQKWQCIQKTLLSWISFGQAKNDLKLVESKYNELFKRLLDKELYEEAGRIYLKL